MSDSFAYSPETVGQAREIYELLAKRVSNRLLVPITYGLMSDRIGTHPRALKHPLAKIQDECSAKGYPTITVLIVDQETGLPNSGCRTRVVPPTASRRWSRSGRSCSRSIGPRRRGGRRSRW